MRVYDISREISAGTPLYPGDPPLVIDRLKDLRGGDAFTLTSVSMGMHTGTHVDAPSHFIEGGPQLDELPLDALVGEAYVATIGGGPRVTADALEMAAVPPAVTRLLLMPAGMPSGSNAPGLYLAREAAEWVVARGIRLLGVESASVDFPESGTFDAHRALLGRGVIIVENLDLGRVAQGYYVLVCLPLKVLNVEASPARAVLFEPFERR